METVDPILTTMARSCSSLFDRFLSSVGAGSSSSSTVGDFRPDGMTPMHFRRASSGPLPTLTAGESSPNGSPFLFSGTATTQAPAPHSYNSCEGGTPFGDGSVRGFSGRVRDKSQRPANLFAGLEKRTELSKIAFNAAKILQLVSSGSCLPQPWSLKPLPSFVMLFEQWVMIYVRVFVWWVMMCVCACVWWALRLQLPRNR
mgnify:CR=1 FL=1